MRDRELRAEALAARAELLERERELHAREAVAEERAAIARELHDLVAHHVSVMVVQAGAERHALGDEHPVTREALGSIEQAGRQALAEARRLLGMLRRDGDAEGLEPQPGVEQVDLLVEQLDRAGLPVTYEVEGDRAPLPAGVDLCAYRVIQEGLTNVLKHAGPAHAHVLVRYGPARLDVEVRDDGRGEPQANGDGTGHGLIGMRERVSLYGGDLQAGPRRARRLRDPGPDPARMSARVLIADDQALVRAGFRKLLESAPDIEVVGEAQDGREAVDLARRLLPSLVLMDIRMPRLDGIEATRRLTADGNGMRVLILTTFGLDEYVYEALRAGASGFMLKDAPPEELLAAITVVARGDALIAPSVTRSVIEEFVRRSPAPRPPRAGARRAHGARARGARAARPRAVERRDRRRSSS